METKLNNPGTLNNESQQKDNVALKTAGMVVGGSVIGAGAAYGATQAYQHLNNSDDDPSISEVPFDREKKDEETEKKDDNKQEKEEKTEEVKKETEKEEVHDDVNGGKTVKDNGSKDRITEDDPAEGLDNVNPDLVAHEIIDGEFVDPNDIDLANFPVEEVGIIETVDGQEISAASFIGEDGEQLFLVDVDNDNNYDYIVDAIDSLKDKALLIRLATQTQARFFSSMGAALKMDPTRIRVAEFWKVQGDPLARALRKRFKHEGLFPQRKFQVVFSDELLQNQAQSHEGPGLFHKAQVNGSLAHITAIFGFMLASLVVNDIAKG